MKRLWTSLSIIERCRWPRKPEWLTPEHMQSLRRPSLVYRRWQIRASEIEESAILREFSRKLYWRRVC